MTQMIEAIAHVVYDRRLIPFNRQNTANYITIMGSFLARTSFYAFGLILIMFAATGAVAPWMEDLRYVAIVLTVLGSVCDGLDGFVARRFNCVTELGKIFDPHHDKIQYVCKTNGLVVDAAIAGALTGTYWYLVGAMTLKYVTGERDETCMFHRLWAKVCIPNVDLSAGDSGKLRTVLCFAGIPIMHFCIMPWAALGIYLIIAAILVCVTLVSLSIYVARYREEIIKHRQA